MRRWLPWVAGVLLLTAGVRAQDDVTIFIPEGESLAAQDPASQEAMQARAQMLLSHGVNLDAAAVLIFLQNGFNMDTLPQGLPREPVMKSMIVNAAIEHLGVARENAAVPVLASILRGEMPAGAERIIRRDFENIPITELDRQVALMKEVLALNSVVALGMIGDDGAREVLLEAMRTHKPTGFITKGALALGQMGSNEGIGPLVELARNVESPDSVAAFQAIFVLTGRNYGVTPNTSLARRRELLSLLNDWYAKEGATVQINRAEVMRRLRVAVSDAPLEPDSLRGLLRTSLDVSRLDREGNDRRFLAAQRLRESAGKRFEELRAIVEDSREDLDIRGAAMRWLAISNPGNAKKYIKRQRDDENPSIAALAEEILKDIPLYEEELEKQGKR